MLLRNARAPTTALGNRIRHLRPTATRAQLQEAYNREILTPFKSRVSETWGELLLDVEAAVTGHWADHHRWDRLSEGEWAELEAKCPFKLWRAAEKRR